MDWLTGWTYRKEVTLVEQSSGAYNDLPTIITTAYDAHMKTDFADCRFTESDGTTLIAYGIKDKTDEVECEFVITRDYTSGASLTVYLYYGNAGAADASVDYTSWCQDWYINNGFGKNPSAHHQFRECVTYNHSESDTIPAWAEHVFGGCTANGGYRTFYGHVKINGTGVPWATGAVCFGIGNAYPLRWAKYNCTLEMYDHVSFVKGASNTVTWGHYAGADTGFWVSWYPAEPSVSFGAEELPGIDLAAQFEVGQDSVGLLARAEIGQDSEDFYARFEVGQDSADLLGKVEAQATADLLGKAVVRNIGSAELLGRAEVQQSDFAELLGKFEAQATADLLGEFVVKQWQEDLPGGFVVRHSGPVPWLIGWSYHKSHTLIGSASGAQTDYQVGIKAYYGPGTDGTEVVDGSTFGKIYCNSKCRADFGDIRFTKSDETSLLDYWLQEKVDSDYAIFWVEVDSIPASPSTVDIYIYYGNPSVTTTSDGDATFTFFDDFTRDRGWTIGNGTYIQIIDPEDVLWIDYRRPAANLYCYRSVSGLADGFELWIDSWYDITPAGDDWVAGVFSLSVNNDGSRPRSESEIYGIRGWGTAYGNKHGLIYWNGVAAGGQSDGDADPDSDRFIYRIRKHDTRLEYYCSSDNVADGTEVVTAGIPAIAYMKAFITNTVAGSSGDDCRKKIHLIRIRKWVYPEPTHTTWGPEVEVGAVGGILFAEFEVGQDSADLYAEFDVGQDSAELLGRFEAQATAELLGNAEVINIGSAELLGEFEVGQGSEDLKAAFDSQVSLNLPAQFEVGHGRADLKAQFTTRQSIPGPVAFGPILIEAATSDAVRFPFQRKSFRVLGRIWVFYTDGTNIRFSSSKDGFRWKTPETIRTGNDGEDFSVVEQNGYIHYAYGPNTLGGNLRYRRGLLSLNGTISWDAEVTAHATTKYIARPFIGIDSTDHPWIGYFYNLSPSVGAPAKIRFRKSSKNDGTWSTSEEFEYISGVSSYLACTISPVSGDRMHIFYCYNNGPLYTRLWDGSMGGAQSLGTIRHRYAQSVTSVGDIVYAVLQKGSTNDLVFRKWDGSWGSEVIIQSSLSNTAPVICAVDANELYVFYVESAVIKYFMSEDAGATWTGTDLKAVSTIPSYWDFNVFSNSGSPIIGIPVSEGADASIIIYDLDWAPELLASFDVGQGSRNLPGKFDVGQGSAEFLGRFEAQATVELLGKFEAQVTAELLGRFEVGQGSAELPALFLIPRAYNFSSGMGISFDWWGSGGVDQQIDFEMWSLTGGWVGRFPDGPAEWRKVQLTWDDLTEVDLDGTRPDSSQIIGIYWTYHTPGVRRIDGIRAWMRQDLLCKVVIRNASSSDLLSKFEVQASQDLLGKFVIQQYFNDLKAGFYVEMTILGALWDYQYVWDGGIQLEIGVQQGQIEEDPTTRALTARLRFVFNNSFFVCMTGGNRVYSKGTFDFDAEVSVYSGANPAYFPAFGLVENKYDRFVGFDDHAALFMADGAGGWDFVTEDDGAIETTPITGINFTAQNTFRIIWEDATEFPANGRVRLWINGAPKATHIVAVPTHPLQFFLLMDASTVAAVDENAWVTLHSFNATGVT